MCGVVGIVGKTDVQYQIYDALTMLQHRGQDAAGIMTCRDGQLSQRKDVGLVRDVFREHHMAQLTGPIGVGHVRYPTAGSSDHARNNEIDQTESQQNRQKNAQPCADESQ
jgi:amidophosphoribosyltransferase